MEVPIAPSYANCGLPYYIGGVIAEREKLLVQTPTSFGQRFRIDVRVENEVIAIHPKDKTITVRTADGGCIPLSRAICFICNSIRY